ncbi:MAG: hypothetical protein ACKO21_03640 [Nodosilinea sp.]
MVRVSDYWQMLQLTSAGQCRPREQPLAKAWFQGQWAEPLAQGSLSEPDLQTHLWQQWRAAMAPVYPINPGSAAADPPAPQPSPKEARLAELCLRCWLSHRIAGVCRQLAHQFGEAYGFTAAALWPLVLDDDGRLESAYRPLSLQILDTYDPTRASLGTWAIRLTQNHPEINQFCLQQGLYRVSNWAILNDTEVQQLPRALPHLSPAELAEATTLLTAYHRVYRQARLALRQGGKGRRCAEPTPEQLQQINPDPDPDLPPDEVRRKTLRRLHDLAEQLRTYRIAVRRRAPLSQSLEGMAEWGVDPEAPGEDLSQQMGNWVEEEFQQRYRQLFRDSLGEALQQVLQGYASRYRQRQPPQDQAYLQALELFHCQGLAMGKIAQQVGLASQVQVSRLMQLKRLRAEVCGHWFNQLRHQVQDRALEHLSTVQFYAIVQQLDQILMEEVTGVMAEAAAEAQMPKHRTSQSLFARQVCHLLAGLDQP